ncbi:MAG: DNA polymerase III subunit delta [Deltaproteobacteria bacterium]
MPQLTPEQAISEAQTGRLRPVYLIAGEERFFRQQVLRAMRDAVVGPGGASLNEDQFVAGEVEARTVLAAARTLPMFGPRRLVVVRDLERWEGKGDDDEGSDGKAEAKGVVYKPLDQLAEYAGAPSDRTTLLLLADKLDNRRRLVSLARKEGFLVVCASLPRALLPGWVRERVREHGHSISTRSADLLAELVGSDLCALTDSIERVELFVGKQAELSEEAVLTCVANMQPATVWDLVGAVGRRDAGAALAALERVFEPGGGPRLVGLLCWSTRQLIRFASARRAGLSADDAARQAGVPPFKVRELSDQLRHLPLERAERWLETLAQVDLDVKGGSRLPQKAVLETALIAFCS